MFRSTPGSKVNKDQATFLLCCNADSSERLPPFVVKRPNNPKCFDGNTGAALGLDYSSAPKAWANRTLFSAWLGRFEAYVARTMGRKVLLLLDNASCHTTGNELPTLYSIQIVFYLREQHLYYNRLMPELLQM